MTLPPDDSTLGPEEESETNDPVASDSPSVSSSVGVEEDYATADTDGLPPSTLVGDISDDDYAALWRPDPERRRQTMKRASRIGIELIQTLILAILIFLAVRAMAQNFRVEGSSMEPGLHNGQYLLVNKAVYFKLDFATLDKFLPFIDSGEDDERFIFHGPNRGDVIVFRYPQDESRDFIKRVIGTPGDTVEIVDGTVMVNGVVLDEPYINGVSHANYRAQVVPEGNYFVLGDNRNNSSDSRSWGYVPEENIIGQAMFTYWPLSELGGVGNRSIDLGFVSLPVPSF